MRRLTFGILLLGVVVSEVNMQYVPKYLQNKYGDALDSGGVSNPGTKTFTKTKTKTQSISSSNEAGSSNSKFRGGCNVEPKTPNNAGLYCSKYSGCKAKCIPNHQFPDGKTEVLIKCVNGNWALPIPEWQGIPDCEPMCIPSCENNGICISPNQCSCPENFSGPTCQYENKACMNLPLLPMNSKRTCNSRQCTVTCLTGHTFPDGSGIATMDCKDGNWVPSKANWQVIPNCIPTCDPPCENGGSCISLNHCRCEKDFRGKQCQYLSSVCAPKTLLFNGAYNCSGNIESQKCSLSCPDGIPFEYPPEKYYICKYSEGVYQPQPIPQCSIPAHVTYMPSFLASSMQEEKKSEGVYRSYKTIEHVHENIMPIKTGSSYSKLTSSVTVNETHEDLMQRDTQKRLFAMEETRDVGGVCFTWGGKHYKTFDGAVYSINTECDHTLVRDMVDGTFSIVISNKHSYRVIKIFLEDKEFHLKKSDDGLPIVVGPRKTITIPGRLPGIRAEMMGDFVVIAIDAVGVKIKWDQWKLVQVEVTESLWRRTGGLCGSLDGNIANDDLMKYGTKAKNVVEFATSWQVKTLGENCEKPIEKVIFDMKLEKTKNLNIDDAKEFCRKAIFDARFQACNAQSEITTLEDECRYDYTHCENADKSVCSCITINVYVRTCIFKGVARLNNWRDQYFCPIPCKNGKIYMSCAPVGGVSVCGAAGEGITDESQCEEGCYCPTGTVLHEDKCIKKDKCPCLLRGKYYPAGHEVSKKCNACVCRKGIWECSENLCGARCSAVGDPHYITFDGKRYNFMGQCSYYLLKSADFSIEAENVACSGSISAQMKFPPSLAQEMPSCTKTLTIKIREHTIKLLQNRELVINGQYIRQIPLKIAGATIRYVSSLYIIVEMSNGVKVWWDGLTRAYVDVPPSFKGKTMGLCGTFNDNQKDDFLTPEHDVEQSVIPFANKWKTSEKCNDIPNNILTHPCFVNFQNKPVAEKHCQKLKSELFSECHKIIDPEEFYEDCLYDMCACEVEISKCLCPIIGFYAEQCAARDVKIKWRAEIRECGIPCPTGQIYQICGNSCTRTCYDITSNPECTMECVEGCNCPEGQAITENGECIPIEKCKCQFDGIEYPPGYKEVRPSSKGLQLCTCVKAKWQCDSKPGLSEEDNPKSKCNITNNFVFTTCESVEPVTCKNMHSEDYFDAGVCHPGCECKKGHVLETKSKTCVKPSDCPCHHGGRSYKEKSVVQSDCNICTCKGGKWDCTQRQCSASCSAWGDSHFKTFDGKMYDYQGQCDYLLAKGTLSSEDNFNIVIQNVPCGTLGVACSKSITIKIGRGEDQEKITLTRGQKVRDSQIFKRFTVRTKDLFVIVEAADLGLVIHWDKGTRVYVKLDPRWKKKVIGLCGNFNENSEDDFQTPSGGIEASPDLFGDSWKLQDFCPETKEILDTCALRPERKKWAEEECNVLKSSKFAACHSEVPLENYIKNCVFDACACDEGGDCECLCTALAAYAQECNNHGVPITWRSQQLCPIQCDERCAHYAPCVSTCPVKTCDNMLIQSPLSKLCKEDSCIEGCEPKLCPPDHVYSNSSLLDCVPIKTCKPICLEINDVTYYEGDLMEQDKCHSCHCSRGKKVCQGKPCEEEFEGSTPTEKDPNEETLTCKDGWTVWINQDKLDGQNNNGKENNKFEDIEPLPDATIMNNLPGKSRCNVTDIANIECRTVMTHLSHKKTGLDVECSLENGLICKSKKGKRPCPDFEIRVLCKCEVVQVLPTCDINGPTPREHPSDCHKFYECAPTSSSDDGKGSWVEKTCGTNLFYNPQSKICDWPSNVISIKPECEDEENGEKPATQDSGGLDEPGPEPGFNCQTGFEYDSCAIRCDQLCLNYLFTLRESGKCLENILCEPGCVPENKIYCKREEMWSNNETCVSINDCMCSTHDGKPIRPGTVIEETECMVCQCVRNYYSCDKTSCPKESGISSDDYSDSSSGITISSTVTPPKHCSPDMYMDLMQGDQPLSDDAFSASGTKSNLFAPKYARINSRVSLTSGGSWSPLISDKNQYLQIDLGQVEPVYGIVIKGSPLYMEYITSFKVMYSVKGLNQFSFITDRNRKPELFRGSIDGNTPVKHIFNEPVEAKLIRVNPQSWHNDIALRIELIGCKSLSTEPPNIIPWGEDKYVCIDEMGINNGKMSMEQITVSSSGYHTKEELKLKSSSGWMPRTNSPLEFIEIDFTGPRKITGFITTGGPKGWVTAFQVKYSRTGNEWNPILDESHQVKTFLGNYDKSTQHKSMFKIPILANFVRFQPVKWHDNIQVKLEIIGCYEPYLPIQSPSPSEPLEVQCNVCPEINGYDSYSTEKSRDCKCKGNLWWDGDKCVSRAHCPCIVDGIVYAIGTAFEKEDCSECICKLGGVSECSPKTCGECEPGLKSTVSSTCSCVCVPCDDGKTLCPTTNVCIDSESWCDGVIDCPDDEVNCETSTTETNYIVSTTPGTEVPLICPEPKSCPPGYKLVVKKPKKNGRPSYFTTMFASYSKKAVKTKYQVTKTAASKGRYKNKLQIPQEFNNPPKKELCPEYSCVPLKPPPDFPLGQPCPPVKCPPGFIPEISTSYPNQSKRNCPIYECVHKPEPDAICNITGNIVNTFDNTEYIHDICDHVLVRNFENLEWDVVMRKTCDGHCTRNLIIHHDEHVFIFYANQSVEFNNYKYSLQQTNMISKNYDIFTISHIGNALLFVSNQYGFWVMWDNRQNVKIGVSKKLKGEVDGLCGFYNGIDADDKRKPDGSDSRTTFDFGESWGQLIDPIVCDAEMCPIHQQNKAWEFCNQVKNEVLNECAKIIDIDAYISRCIGTTCKCLDEENSDSYKATERCRCQALEAFVVDCLAADNSVELTDWRTLHDCPVYCKPPLVYHDCYQRSCEPTCDSISDPELCQKQPNICFPGCYCPPGLVRKDDSCIPSSSCKDCECNILPHLEYITYDENNFTVNGNCVYIMSRDVLEKYHDEHNFQVLITNAPCSDNPSKMCVGKITILVQGHKMHVYRDVLRNNLRLMVDSERVSDFSEIADFVKVTQTKSKHMKLIFQRILLQVNVYFPSLGVSVKVPSHKYGGKLEGLCGDCNRDPSNDMKLPTGEIVQDQAILGPSWLYDKLPGMTKESCANQAEEVCQPIQEDADPCMQLFDANRYGQCHPLLSPGMFFDWCQKDICTGQPERACAAISSFARECLSYGFCIQWHTDLCPIQQCKPDQEFNHCGPSCQETCEDVLNPEKANKCVSVPTDGCFCPAGKVILNGTCVERNVCEICDDEGHHSGEKWQKDACTYCECQGTNRKCETKQCPQVEIICKEGYAPMKIDKPDTECCDIFVCSSGPEEKCDQPPPIKCASDQVPKLGKDILGCPEFVCVCKPPKDCDKLNTSHGDIEDGMVEEIDNSGCCPVAKLTCKPITCPKPPTCDEFYKLKKDKVPSKCCPTYTCEAPKKCVAKLLYTADEKGGERLMNKFETQTVLKDPGEEWMDGPCRTCTCYGSESQGFQSVCITTECPNLKSIPDYVHYNLTTKPVKGECCPEIVKTSCKFNGKIYEVGEMWIASDDACTKMECIETKNRGIQKLTQHVSCDTNCSLGFEYLPSNDKSKICCGACVPVACVINGDTKEVGEKWSSPNHCIHYECLNIAGSLQTLSTQEVCDEVPQHMQDEYVYEINPVEGKCCNKYVQTACRVNNEIYQIGQTYPSPDGDKCKQINCTVNESGELSKQEIVETCHSDCALGWQYIESKVLCCGECIQVSCIVGGEIKNPGEIWLSDDNCTSYTCEESDGDFMITSHSETCPDIEDCDEKDIYVKGCCKHCKKTPQEMGTCIPEEIESSSLIGAFVENHPRKGLCTNHEALVGFKKCVGACHSGTSFNKKLASFTNECTCCTATKYEKIEVELTCESDSNIKKTVDVPQLCACLTCEQANNK